MGFQAVGLVSLVSEGKTLRFARTLHSSVLSGLIESSMERLRHCVRIAGSRADHSRALSHLRLAATPQRVRQPVQYLLCRVPVAGHTPDRGDQRQRVSPLSRLPGDLLERLQVPTACRAPQARRAARAEAASAPLSRRRNPLDLHQGHSGGAGAKSTPDPHDRTVVQPRKAPCPENAAHN